MIVVSELRKAYGSRPAVDGVSFEIRPRETFGLLGPNGAGKTTTIHMLIGLLRPDSGTVHIDGVLDPARPEARRSIGIAPQSLSLYDEFTAEENLRFFGRLYGLHGERLRAAVEAALEHAELGERRSDRVVTLSGGMKRRLQLGCALVHGPQVLLLDEPTVGVDPQARLHIHRDIQRLRQEGRTILLTTHYMEEAEKLCDRVAIMDHGRILAVDTVHGILERYGGRSVVRAELEPGSGDDGEHLAHFEAAGLHCRRDGDCIVVETAEPFEVIRQLASADASVQKLTIEKPNLESVFLNLTGRSLRD